MRWERACLAGADEAELWPELRGGRGSSTWPAEIVAVYPHVSSVPGELWRRLVGSSVRDLGVLTGGGRCLAGEGGLATLLGSRAAAGVRERVLLPDAGGAEGDVRQVLRALRPLPGVAGAEVRLYRVVSYNSMLLADQDIVVGHRIHGLPASEWPVLHLRDGSGELSAGYRESFESVWESALPYGAE